MLRDDTQSLEKDLKMKSNTTLSDDEEEGAEIHKYFVHLSPLPKGAAPSVRTERELTDVSPLAGGGVARLIVPGSDLAQRHEENMRRARQIGLRQRRRRRRQGQMAAEAAAYHPSALDLPIHTESFDRGSLISSLNEISDRLGRGGNETLNVGDTSPASSAALLAELLSGNNGTSVGVASMPASADAAMLASVANGTAAAVASNLAASSTSPRADDGVVGRLAEHRIRQEFQESSVREAFLAQHYPQYNQIRDHHALAVLAGSTGSPMEAALASSLATMNASAAVAAVPANPYCPQGNLEEASLARTLGMSRAAVTSALALEQYHRSRQQQQQQAVDSAFLSAVGTLAGVESTGERVNATDSESAATSLLRNVLMAVPGNSGLASMSLPDVLDQVAANAGGLAASLRLLQPNLQGVASATSPEAAARLSSSLFSPPSASQILNNQVASSIVDSSDNDHLSPGTQRTLFPFY